MSPTRYENYNRETDLQGRPTQPAILVSTRFYTAVYVPDLRTTSFDIHATFSRLTRFHLSFPVWLCYGERYAFLPEAFSDFLHSYFNNQSRVCALFSDLTKGLDSVNHENFARQTISSAFRCCFIFLLGNFLSCRSRVMSFIIVRTTKV